MTVRGYPASRAPVEGILKKCSASGDRHGWMVTPHDPYAKTSALVDRPQRTYKPASLWPGQAY